MLTTAVSAEPVSPPTPEALPKGLHIVAICARGFEEAIEGAGTIEYKKANDEEFCLMRSLCLFKEALGFRCEKLLPGEKYSQKMLPTYDLNKNEKADCEDFELWKKWLTQEAARGRKNLSLEDIERTVVLKECE